MTDVNKTLEGRGARYGSFEDHAVISQGLLDSIRKLPAWEKLEPDMRQAISTIFDKIARIMNGDPYYTDNWHDITGYATLVERRLLKMEEARKGILFEEPSENPDAEWVSLPTPGRPMDDALRMPTGIPEQIRNDQDRRDGRPITFPEIENAVKWVAPHDKASDPDYDVGNYRG